MIEGSLIRVYKDKIGTTFGLTPITIGFFGVINLILVVLV